MLICLFTQRTHSFISTYRRTSHDITIIYYLVCDFDLVANHNDTAMMLAFPVSLIPIFSTSGVYLLDFFCSGIQFNLLLSPYPCFISLLYLDLYVLGDDALIS